MKECTKRAVTTCIVAIILAGCGSATAGKATTTNHESEPTPSTEPQTVVSSPSIPVPSPYQATYNALEGQLNTFASIAGSAATSPKADKERPVLSFGLETSNGNAMHPGVLEGKDLEDSAVIVQRMKELGATGVTIEVSFPLLLPDFPDSSEYTTFYTDIAQMVHQAKMTLTVEENPLFENISTIPVFAYYSSLNLQSYAAADHQMAQVIIDIMHPTYLSVLTEPDTYTALLHQPAIDLNSPEVGVQFVDAVISGLDKDGTLVGAGTGSWTSPIYDQDLISKTPIDYVDMHIYPIAKVDLDNMVSDVSEAKAAHKPLLMSECWMYPLSTNGYPLDSVQAAPDEQSVISYSFWEPLDERFLTDVYEYARTSGFLVVSPNSTLNLFAYQTYTPVLAAETPQQIESSFYAAVTTAVESNQFSPTGETYRYLAG